jgi:serine/threonine-protein kinase
VAVDGVPYVSTQVSVTVAVRVPDVVRAVESEACPELEAAQLGCTLVPAGNAPPPGLVLAQEPAAGTLVDPGTAVTVQVFRLESRTPVPNVVGLDADAACAPVEAVKLVCDRREITGGGTPGTVVGQAPPAQTSAPSGSRVTVRVLRPQEQVSVPDLAGAPEDAACQRLYAARLACAPTVAGDGPAPGRVVGQRPAAGTQVPVDFPVVVQLRREQGIAVPDVVGRQADEACRTVGEARLACRPNGAVDGRVLSQDPPAGTLVAAASDVFLLLPVPEPDRPWWPIAAAAAAALVVAAGLVARASYRRRRRRRLRAGPRVEVELHTGSAIVRVDEAREW